MGSNDDVLDLDFGNPLMYYPYWKKVDEECSVTIKASELMSYFADESNINFYQLPCFTDAIRRLHRVAGNAVTEGRYIVGGTGASQLILIALRALASSLNTNEKLPVVCAEPYYSVYREAIKEERSEILEWGGDAKTCKFKEEGPYIEIVTTPNNPDGRSQKPLGNTGGGLVVYDLAYYWPQYTPITTVADYDIMLFTLSKATGHAGSRVGWAIVRDQEIAEKMANQIVVTSNGVCHEGQLRATKIMEHIANYYHNCPNNNRIKLLLGSARAVNDEGFFEFGHQALAQRWQRLKDVVKHYGGAFSLPDFSPEYCNFMRKHTSPTPAFAWMECKTGEDAAKLMMDELKIRVGNGARFGSNVSPKYVRVNMMCSDQSFNLFLQRLASLQLHK